MKEKVNKKDKMWQLYILFPIVVNYAAIFYLHFKKVKKQIKSIDAPV